MSADTAMPRWVQAGLIGAVGVAAAVALWALQPTRAALGPVDFVVGGPDALPFCDPLHPRFIAVTDKASPVTLTANAEGRAGSFVLKTATGKPINADDVLDGKVHLLAVNATVSQFDVGDALFSGKEGVWNWAVPMGSTRVFADFTPLATGAEMYVACAVPRGDSTGAAPSAGGLALAIPSSVAAGQEAVINVQAVGGGMISQPLSVAAFDAGKSGPTGCVVRRSDSAGNAQAFRLTFNDPGRYVVWAKTGDRTGRAEITVEP